MGGNLFVKSRIVAALCSALTLAAIVGISIASADRPKGAAAAEAAAEASADLRDAVAFKGMSAHLETLQSISDDNDGNRASGFSGYEASVKYVAKTLKKAGWDVSTQEFDFEAFVIDEPTVFEQTAPTATKYKEDKDFNTMEFSGSGEVTAELVAIDLKFPPPKEPGVKSGCKAKDFEGLDVVGKIALIQRGTCDFAVKVKNAAKAGAAGAIIFNEGQKPDRVEIVDGTLGTEAKIPAVDTSFKLGSELANGVANGPTGVTVHIKTTTHVDERTAENVIAETPGGSDNNVVMAGAHLDSVEEGAGINDNGTGSAALLEIADQISDLGIDPKNKIRLGWWGAEEVGLIGSTEYVASLKKTEAKDIALYLNFDMLGSPNFVRQVYDGDGSAFGAEGPKGSDAIEHNYEKFFKSEDLPTGETAFDGRSDYLAFITAGIPSGGLFSGAEEIKTKKEQKLYGGKAGEPYDPCYHEKCDDIDNVSKKSLDPMADAVADSIMTYAFNLSALKSGGSSKAEKTKSAAATDYSGHSLVR
jgi:Zn-dependent M28 family amino/carboxypeptidase